jgi:hypothetical protein
MTEFLVELFVSKTQDSATVTAEAERLSTAADELTAEGRPVRLVRSIFVPEDETCYLLFEAGAVEHVRETALRAALPLERVVEAALDLTNHERSTSQ